MATTILHKANTRGLADHGWLQSRQTFSFAGYYDPQRIQFGALRVLNDDVVSAAQGFGRHPHDNMEIISIPLEGELRHKDSMGNEAVITTGEIQVMSAGTGIFHEEYNNHKDEAVKFLQIWLFPNKRNVTPRYDQLRYDELTKKNELQQILSPDQDDEGVWIYQDAWFFIGDFDAGKATDYTFKKAGNGAYIFVLTGDVNIDGQVLNERDGYGISDTESFQIEATSAARILIMEVPMQL